MCVMIYTADEALIYGDPSYITFDGQKYEFNEEGTYLLLSSTSPNKKTFRISHKITEVEKSGVSKLQRIYLVFNGNKIRIGPGNTLVVSYHQIK